MGYLLSEIKKETPLQLSSNLDEFWAENSAKKAFSEIDRVSLGLSMQKIWCEKCGDQISETPQIFNILNLGLKEYQEFPCKITLDDEFCEKCNEKAQFSRFFTKLPQILIINLGEPLDSNPKSFLSLREKDESTVIYELISLITYEMIYDHKEKKWGSHANFCLSLNEKNQWFLLFEDENVYKTKSFPGKDAKILAYQRIN